MSKFNLWFLEIDECVDGDSFKVYDEVNKLGKLKFEGDRAAINLLCNCLNSSPRLKGTNIKARYTLEEE